LNCLAVEKAHTFLNTTYTTWSIGSFQKKSVLPSRRKFLLLSEGGGDKKLFLIVNVLGHPKGVGGFNFLFPLWEWYGCFLEWPIFRPWLAPCQYCSKFKFSYRKEYFIDHNFGNFAHLAF
jgi:hypothetical protein